MRLPVNHSKASFYIFRKSEKPDSAIVHPPERVPVGKQAAVEAVEKYAIWMAEHGCKFDNCRGRKPGSRIVWDEELEVYTVVNPE